MTPCTNPPHVPAASAGDCHCRACRLERAGPALFAGLRLAVCYAERGEVPPAVAVADMRAALGEVEDALGPAGTLSCEHCGRDGGGCNVCAPPPAARARCGVCGTALTLARGYGGTGLCGPCATGEAAAAGERGETW